MAVRKPRSRLVYFRISEEEFDQFTRACETQGARSLSDLARAAMHQFLVGPPEPANQDLAGRLQQLDETVHELGGELRRLVLLLQERTEPAEPGRKGPHESSGASA